MKNNELFTGPDGLGCECISPTYPKRNKTLENFYASVIHRLDAIIVFFSSLHLTSNSVSFLHCSAVEPCTLPAAVKGVWKVNRRAPSPASNTSTTYVQYPSFRPWTKKRGTYSYVSHALQRLDQEDGENKRGGGGRSQPGSGYP